MQTHSAKAKGRRLQYRVRDEILESLPDLTGDDIMSRPMSSAGPDIILSAAARNRFPFGIECKNQEKLSIWRAWDQAEKNAGELIPILIIARNRHDPLAIMHFSDWLKLAKNYK